MTPVAFLAPADALAKPGRSSRVLGSHFYQPSRMRTLKRVVAVSVPRWLMPVLPVPPRPQVPGNTAPVEGFV